MEQNDEDKPRKLTVVDEHGLRSEEFFRGNGVQDTVYVVVKSHVFRVEVACADGLALPSGINWVSTLAYDSDGGQRKLVPVVKAAPVKVTAKRQSNGHYIFSCKLTVLTSQHEGMFFRIMFKGAFTGGVYEGESSPIRVISKPESSTKKRGRAAAAGDAEEKPKRVQPLTSAEEMLGRMSALQLEAHELLRKLQHYDALPAEAEMENPRPPKRLDFGACFEDVLVSYKRLIGAEERTRHAEHLIGLLPSVAPLQELRDLTQAVQAMNSAGPSSMSSGVGDMGRFTAPESGQGFGGRDDAMVTFNDLFVSVPPTAATTTTISIDGHDFDILDFDIPASTCVCENCNYKQEVERMEKFASEAGMHTGL